MRCILVCIITSVCSAAGLAARAQASDVPPDVSALVANRAVCAKILARGWGDERPWGDHGCYNIDAPVAGLLRKYAQFPDILDILNRPWTQSASYVMRPAALAMRTPHVPGSLWPLAALDWHDGHAVDAPAAVAVVSNEIVMTAPPDVSARLTHDSVKKTDPVFSRDGQKIAFLEEVDPSLGVGRIVIIDRKGHELKRIDVRPPQMRIPQPLMPPEEPKKAVFWERIARYQWLSGDRIAIQSSSKFYEPNAFLILDSKTGKVLTSFVDTGPNARFSTDGAHYYYRADIHLGYICTCPPNPNVEPFTIRTDVGVLTLPEDRQIDLDYGAVWSEDGSRLFMPFLDRPLNNYIYVWSHGVGTWLDGKFGGVIQRIYLKNGDLFVVTATGQGLSCAQHGWKFPGGRQTAVPFKPGYGDEDPASFSEKHRNWLEQTLTTIDPEARTPDFWCKDCDLAMLPRASKVPE